MKKLLLISIALLIAGVVAIYIYLDVMIKHSIETYGSQAIGSRISVGWVSTFLKNGDISIAGIHIANPPGFKGQNIFECAKIEASLDIKSIFSNVVKINRINISYPSIIYELGPVGDNVSAFKKRVHSVDNSNSQASAANSSQDKKIIISDIRITGGTAVVSLAQLAQKPIKLPEIHISGIGGTQGATISEASQQITDEVARVVAEANIQKLMGNVESILEKRGTIGNAIQLPKIFSK